MSQLLLFLEFCIHDRERPPDGLCLLKSLILLHCDFLEHWPGGSSWWYSVIIWVFGRNMIIIGGGSLFRFITNLKWMIRKYLLFLSIIFLPPEVGEHGGVSMPCSVQYGWRVATLHAQKLHQTTQNLDRNKGIEGVGFRIDRTDANTISVPDCLVACLCYLWYDTMKEQDYSAHQVDRPLRRVRHFSLSGPCVSRRQQDVELGKEERTYDKNSNTHMRGRERDRERNPTSWSNIL